MEESKDVNMGCEYKVSPAVSDDGGVCLSLADRSPAPLSAPSILEPAFDSQELVLEERPTASLPGAWRTDGPSP